MRTIKVQKKKFTRQFLGFKVTVIRYNVATMNVEDSGETVYEVNKLYYVSHSFIQKDGTEVIL